MSAKAASLPAQTAAGATSTTYVGAIDGLEDLNGQLVRAVLTPPAGYSTVTGVATNNATFNARQLRAGAVLGTIASVTLGVGNNLVAEVPLSMPITTFGASAQFQTDDVVDVQMVQNGTGLAVAVGVQLALEFV